MAKVKIDSGLLVRAKKVYKVAGYSSLEEFVDHIIEKEVAKYEAEQVEEKVADQLRGLGYLE